MKLTSKAIAALDLPQGKTDHIAWDDAMPGFGYRLRRGAAGKLLRSWIVQYRRAGASRRLLLGSAEVLGAEQARIMAKKALGRIANGEDPQGERVDRRDKDRVKVRSMIDEYLLQKQSRVRRRTMEEIARYLTGSYFRPLHALPIDQITRRDVAAQLVVITREHGSIAAARARSTLSAFYVWAMQSGLVEVNPVIGTLKPQDAKSRERVLNDGELVALWRACDDASEYGKIIRLLILLGARRNEIGGMCWREFDLENARWTLPAPRSKNGRAHTLPLMPTALAIIKAVPQMVGRDQLFGERALTFTAWAKNKTALDRRSGVTGWTVHDIRRSVATRMADLGIGPHIIEAILNHHSGHRGGIAGVYNRSRYEREVKAAVALWSDHVRALVEGGERKVLGFPQASA